MSKPGTASDIPFGEPTSADFEWVAKQVGCPETSAVQDNSDETWGRLQMAYRARKHMAIMLAQWTEEVRALETLRHGHPITERTKDVTGA